MSSENPTIVEEVSVVQVMDTAALAVQSRAEVDSAIDIAKRYPRDLQKSLKNIEFLACQDRETAAACFYSLPRGGKTISGPSVRFAEIIVASYGNFRVSSRIIADEGKRIIAQAVAFDLENNIAFQVEVSTRVTDKYGKRMTEDMVLVTCNAARAKAERNAVFKTVPLAITHNIQDKIKDVVLGKSADFETTRAKAIKHFTDQKIKDAPITEKMVLTLLGRTEVEDVTRDDVFALRGLVTAIKEGDTTLELAFATKPKNTTAPVVAEVPATEDQKKELMRLINNPAIDDLERNVMILGVNSMTEPKIKESIENLKQTIKDRGGKAKQ